MVLFQLIQCYRMAARGAVALWMVWCTCTCACAEMPSVTAVQDAWNNRQAQVPSARFEWTVTEFIASGSMKAMRSSGGREAVLTSNTTLERSVCLLLSGTKMRYSYIGQAFEGDADQIVQKQYISVFDGETSRSFHEDMNRDVKEYPLAGFVRTGPENKDFRNREITPMLVTFRACEANNGGVDLDSYNIGAKMASVNGHMCVVLHPRVWTEEQYKRTYWVDPDREFIVLRIVYGRMGKPPIYTTDIDYQRDVSGMWIPSSWETIVTSGSATHVDSQVSVTGVVYTADSDIPDAEFTLEFPPGTAVVDRRSANDTNPIGDRFVVREDGNKRIVTNEELSRGARYSDLVSTESGEAAKIPDRRGYRFVVVAVVSAMCLGIVVFAFWRTRR